MNSVQPPDSFESADYVGVLRRRWWIVLVFTCIGLVGAYAYTVVAPKSYTATAEVNVSPNATDQSNQVQGSRTNGATVNLDTEAQVVVSGTVATIAAHLMHSSVSPAKLSKDISVTVPPNSSVLAIECKQPSGTAAAGCATAFAQAYLQNRSTSATNTINAEIATLNKQLAPMESKVTSLSSKASTLPSNSVQKLSTEAQLKLAEGQVHSLNDQISTLTGQLANTKGGYIITTPQPPTSPSSPRKLLVIPSGLVAGLLIGLIVAFLVDRRDKRVHGAEQVERALDLPVMLSLPKAAFGRPISVASPRSRTGQAFTELANSTAAALGDGNHVVAVVGTAPGAGTSVIAANLAVTLARTYSAAVLVCANLNGTVVPELLGLNGDGEGLSELVAGTASVRDAVRAPGAVPGLWVITPGADPSLAVYNLQHDTAQALTSQLRMDARFVVIELQATDDGADTFGLAEFSDAALIAVEDSRTQRPVAISCVRRLRRLRVPILGAVVYPPVGERVAVRPPRQAQPRVGVGPGEAGRDGLEAGRGHGDLSPSAITAGGQERRSRPARTRNGSSGHADRVAGS